MNNQLFRNVLKEKLSRGESAVGAGITVASSDTVELIARMNFDWLFLDIEHSPLNPEMLATMLQVARLGQATPIVRVSWNDPVVIKKCLDVGAMGIIVPWVSSRAEAESAVRAARYPPQGTRGFGPRWLLLAAADMAEYNRSANDEILVLVQIETREAVACIEKILTTPGVDGFMIGPADLANALGHGGDFTHPEVEATIQEILERSRAVQTISCFAPAPADVCLRRVEQGFQMVCLGSDINFIRWGAQQALSVLGRPMYRG